MPAAGGDVHSLLAFGEGTHIEHQTSRGEIKVSPDDLLIMAVLESLSEGEPVSLRELERECELRLGRGFGFMFVHERVAAVRSWVDKVRDPPAVRSWADNLGDPSKYPVRLSTRGRRVLHGEIPVYVVGHAVLPESADRDPETLVAFLEATKKRKHSFARWRWARGGAGF